MSTALTLVGYHASAILAGTQPGDNTGGEGPDFGKASPVALLLLLVLFVAVGFLIRSMTKHLKKVPASFEKSEDTPDADGDDAPADGASEGKDAAAAQEKQDH